MKQKDAIAISVPESEFVVLDKNQVAKLLLVSPECVYEMTRARARSRLPFFKAGKYIRFSKSAVLAWVQAQQEKHGQAA
jgi:excisionase family DNA binding protein